MTNDVMRVRCPDCPALVWQFLASTTSALDPLSRHLTVLLGEAPPHCDSEFCGGQASKRIEVCLIHGMCETPEDDSRTMGLWHPGH